MFLFGKKSKKSITSELPTELLFSETGQKEIRIKQMRAAYWSHPGMVRSHNEDSLVWVQALTADYRRLPVRGLGLVADGMGGLDSGEVASSYVAQLFQEEVQVHLFPLWDQESEPEGATVLKVLEDVVQRINRRAFERLRAQGEKTGTTLTACLIADKHCFVTHVGDSRLYRLKRGDGGLERLTKDHSYAGRLLELGQIDEAEARNHPRKNEIYKMMVFYEQVEPDCFHQELAPGDWLLLCSDGLVDMVEDREIADIFNQERGPEELVNRLGHLANQRGGRDNCTILCLEPIWSTGGGS